MNESREGRVIPRPGRLRRFLKWWVIGPWRAKTLKVVLGGLLIYNILTFFLMWCPPVKGVVVDISTGKPIEGAIVQKAAGGPFIFPSLWPGGAHTGGAFSQAVTDKSGRFSFPGALAHPTPSEFSWFMVLWPFQWVDRVDLRAWDKNYVGVSCSKGGLWWLRDQPVRSERSCEVRRYRLPILGFYYKILLKRPSSEREWQTKISSVTLDLNGHGSVEQGRLFNDLTGYLEQWPEGEKAGEYVIQLADLAVARKAEVCSEGRLRAVPAETLEKAIAQMQTTLKFIDAVPLSALSSNPVKQANWLSDRASICDGLLILTQENDRRKGAYRAR